MPTSQALADAVLGFEVQHSTPRKPKGRGLLGGMCFMATRRLEHLFANHYSASCCQCLSTDAHQRPETASSATPTGATLCVSALLTSAL